MPLYEYACQKCGHQLEARQKISDDPLKTCPKCGEEALERLVSRSSFALKGSGWYADGYGAKSSSSESKPETKSESKPASETKSEAKPAETKSSETKTAAPKPEAAKPKKDSGD